jgi:hypothetical protein
MNLKNGHENSQDTFVLVNVISTLASVFAFIIAVTYIKWKRIM